jgi:putative SOS response-associated peptidase YedK
MLKPCPDESLKIWPVNKMVGNVRNKGPSWQCRFEPSP